MRNFVVVLVVVALVGMAAARVRRMGNPELDEDWNAWKAKHGKSYAKQEEHNRRLIWENNLKTIQHHNLARSLGQETFTLGVNQFSDLTSSEFTGAHLKTTKTILQHSNLEESDSSADCRSKVDTNVELPPSVDWRANGYVTPVRNSGACLSSEYFSINGALEGQWVRKTGELIALSEQNLADCCGTGSGQCSAGCSFDQAYQYIKSKGIESLADYPDTGAAQQCQYDPKKRSATVSGYDFITPSGNESVLQTFVATIGPISVFVDASQPSFQTYARGVYNEPACSSTELDHAMVIVGYGTDATGGDYWIVKNSWGLDWGMEGYIWMSRNKNNQCGIASMASYPYFTC